MPRVSPNSYVVAVVRVISDPQRGLGASQPSRPEARRAGAPRSEEPAELPPRLGEHPGGWFVRPSSLSRGC